MKTENELIEIMQTLCEKPRPAGSPQGEAIADYLLAHYSELGYQVEVQPFTFEGWELVEPPRVEFLKPTEREVAHCLPVVWSGSTGNDAVVGKLSPAGQINTFEAYPWERYAILDETGNPAAYLLTREDMVWGQPLDDASEKTPYIIVDTDACQWIRNWLKDHADIVVSASVESRYLPNQRLNNLIASKSGQADIVVCAHYDSFFNTVGAHDNASGTTALLCLASALSEQECNHFRFVAFDAEEWNKLGAYSYVERLRREGELEQIRLVVNIDSVGIGQKIYILTSPSIEETVKGIVSGLDVGHEVEIQVSSRAKFPQFDSWPFMKQGVPVMQIGTIADPPFQAFHDPDDTLEHIDLSLIGKVVQMVKGIVQQYPV